VPRVLLASFVGGLSALGCSWTRFGDVVDDPPVVMLERPDTMTTGFGVTLTAAEKDGRSLLLVGGEPGTSAVALFALGTSAAPGTKALDTHFCNGASGQCFLGAQVAYLAQTQQPEGHSSPDASSCVALGLGKSNLDGPGVFFECEDRASFTRKVLPQYEEDVDFALRTDQNETVVLAGDGAPDPAILVGAPSALTLGRAWYYPPDAVEPVELAPAGKSGAGYGSKVLALAIGENSWLFAVAAPGAGELHLFRATGDEAHYVGCLGGSPGFGRTLASGFVRPGSKASGDLPELLVSDDDTVYVFEAAPLAALPDATDVSCSLAALPPMTLRNSFGCGSTKDTSDCSTSSFGVALAVGDVDGDGDGEVLVGAPQMTVHGTHGVGAVLVYDAEQPGDGTLSDTRFVTQGTNGDSIGGSLAAASIGGRDVIVAGGPRNGKVALFYCSALVPPALRDARCEAP
jgi:hypothetical protein